MKISAAKLYSRLDRNGHNLCKTVCMDVRLLLYSFCVFSEQWSLGSLYTCIRWSRLMSRGPHTYCGSTCTLPPDRLTHLHLKLAFCKNLPISWIVVSWTKTWVSCEYIQSTHWFATGYFIGQAWKNMIWWRILRWRTCKLGRFPVRMPVGLRQMAWVQVIDEDFRSKLYSTWP